MKSEFFVFLFQVEVFPFQLTIGLLVTFQVSSVDVAEVYKSQRLTLDVLELFLYRLKTMEGMKANERM